MSKKSVFLFIAIVAAIVFVGCSGKKEATSTSSSNNTTMPLPNENNVTAAFQQFGVDVGQIIPNVATADDAANQRNSNVSSSVYTARAYYREKSNAAISNEIALAYKERIFNYTKSISADNKCYCLRFSQTETPKEVMSFADLQNVTGAYDDWCYKFNGNWINVVTLFYSLGDEIGLDLTGFGTY